MIIHGLVTVSASSSRLSVWVLCVRDWAETERRGCEILHKDAFVLGARRDGDPAEGMDALVLGVRGVRDPAEGCYCLGVRRVRDPAEGCYCLGGKGG